MILMSQFQTLTRSKACPRSLYLKAGSLCSSIGSAEVFSQNPCLCLKNIAKWDHSSWQVMHAEMNLMNASKTDDAMCKSDKTQINRNSEHKKQFPRKKDI